MKKIGKILLILCLFLFLLQSNEKKEKSPLGNILPFSLFQIQSGSMMPEMQIGEIILLWKQENYQEKDIITYQVEKSYLVTHRILKKTEEGYITKGDFNNVEDEKIVTLPQIKGKVIFHSRLLGKLFQYRYWCIGILSFLWLIEERRQRERCQ